MCQLLFLSSIFCCTLSAVAEDLMWVSAQLPHPFKPGREMLATALALGWSRKVSLCFRTFCHNALAACGPKQAV